LWTERRCGAPVTFSLHRLILQARIASDHFFAAFAVAYAFMSKNARIAIAEQTLAALEAGQYPRADGAMVHLKDAVQRAVAHSAAHDLAHATFGAPAHRFDAPLAIEVTSETSLAALARLSAQGEAAIGLLNFASARNPGGGFLGGAQAQEEAITRSGALYPCLTRFMDEVYERNRKQRSLLYLDLAIASPQVPFFRDDAGAFLNAPLNADVVTCAAPNAGAIAKNAPGDLAHVEETLRRRARFVLALFERMQTQTLILGAWGCGVFRNDPKMVAAAFAQCLCPKAAFTHTFKRVVFAIPGGETDRNYAAFAACFGAASRDDAMTR
jgi:uncharacterized protein (TIGR02452 family)